MTKRVTVIVIGSLVVVIGFVLWWFYGSGLSEGTAYKLAEEYAQTYAMRNHLDLNLYSPPAVGSQKGNRVYTFSWMPKQGGKPLTIVVDRTNVEVAAIESPVSPPQKK